MLSKLYDNDRSVTFFRFCFSMPCFLFLCIRPQDSAKKDRTPYLECGPFRIQFRYRDALHRHSQIGSQRFGGVRGVGIALPVKGSQFFHVALHPADGDGTGWRQDEDAAGFLQGV